MIFQKERFWIEHRRILTEEQSLNFDKLNVSVLRVLARKARGVSSSRVCGRLFICVIILQRLLVGGCYGRIGSLGRLSMCRAWLRLGRLIVLRIAYLWGECHTLSHADLLLVTSRGGLLILL